VVLNWSPTATSISATPMSTCRTKSSSMARSVQSARRSHVACEE
jgi:hypothetical protein